MRVLVVSESAAERLRAAAALRARPGLDVAEASSAADAHRLIDAGDLDCVVMDGDMRPEGGFSVLYEARARAQMTGERLAPSVILVAREDDRWLARWAGADEVVVKPVDSFHVAELVLALLERTGGAVPAETAGVTVGEALSMDRPPEIDRPDAPPLEQDATPPPSWERPD